MTDVTDPKDLQPTFEDVFDGIAFEALQILYDRQRKYGPENIRQQGLWGIFTRIKDDKIERVRRAFNGAIKQGLIRLDEITDSDDESFEDALFDIANYALIMIAVKRGVWGFPMREDTGEVETLAAGHPDGVPQLTLTQEEEEAERARQALAGEDTVTGEDLAFADDAFDPMPSREAAVDRLRGRMIAQEVGRQVTSESDLDELKRYMSGLLDERDEERARS